MPTRLADSTQIDVPAEVAWAFLSEPPRFHAIQPNTSVQLLSGTFDTVGSRYLVTFGRRTFAAALQRMKEAIETDAASAGGEAHLTEEP